MSLLATIKHLERQIRLITRQVDVDSLNARDKRSYEQIHLACNELKLDLRDYEYAETRVEQLKWAKIARHNLKALETYLLELSDMFGPVDIAELSATVDAVREQIA